AFSRQQLDIVLADARDRMRVPRRQGDGHTRHLAAERRAITHLPRHALGGGARDVPRIAEMDGGLSGALGDQLLRRGELAPDGRLAILGALEASSGGALREKASKVFLPPA